MKNIFELIEIFAQETDQGSQIKEDERKFPGITAKRVSAIRILQELYNESPYYKQQIKKMLDHLVKKNDSNYNRANLASDGLVLSLQDFDAVLGAMISCWQESLAINRMGQVVKALADYPDSYDVVAAAKRLKEGAKRGNISMTDAVASRKDILRAMAMKDNFVPDFDVDEIPELEETEGADDSEDPEIKKNIDNILGFVDSIKQK